jgi:hypothetical protein
MNTPKSKTPKRYTHKSLKPGQHTGVVENDEIAALLGRFIVKWNHTEEMMIGLFMELTTIQDQGIARITFRSIIGQRAREKIMKAVLQRALIHKSKPVIFDELIAEFMALNDVRNDYVHGRWWTDDAHRTILQVELATWDHAVDGREITKTEIEGNMQKMNELMLKLMSR